MYAAKGMRPELTNLYMADTNGDAQAATMRLAVDVRDDAPTALTDTKAYPNPLSSGTMIAFVVPPSSTAQPVQVAVYDEQGNVIAQLMNTVLEAGNCVVRWDGKTSGGTAASNGVYNYTVTIDNVRHFGSL